MHTSEEDLALDLEAALQSETCAYERAKRGPGARF
jgi:hypothetical protein